MNPGLRQVPIANAIASRGSDAAQAIVIDYVPGNGSRYVLVIVDLSGMPKGSLEAMGRAGERCFMVSWMNGGAGRAMTCGGNDFLHYRYVEEKLGAGLVDAVVLAEAIAYTCGLSAIGCEEYERDLKRSDSEGE